VEESFGAWNHEAAGLNHGTTEEKHENFVSFIRERLKEYGALHYGSFLFSKARWITSEGNFFWMSEAGGPAEFPNPEGNILREFMYPNGKWFSYYLLSANGLWIVIFFGLCMGMLMPCFTGFGKNRLRRNFDLFLCLAVFFSIFVILFTEGRSRYLISFLPIFCIVSVSGYAYLGQLVKNMLKRERKSDC